MMGILFKYQNSSLEMLPFYDYADLKGKEKDLENLLADNLGELYIEDGQLMPIFQERQWWEEPDLCALDKDGNQRIWTLIFCRIGFIRSAEKSILTSLQNHMIFI